MRYHSVPYLNFGQRVQRLVRLQLAWGFEWELRHRRELQQREGRGVQPAAETGDQVERALAENEPAAGETQFRGLERAMDTVGPAATVMKTHRTQR